MLDSSELRTVKGMARSCSESGGGDCGGIRRVATVAREPGRRVRFPSSFRGENPQLRPPGRRASTPSHLGSEMTTNMNRQQRSRRSDPQNLPIPIPSEADLVTVDTTWGKVQPLQPFPDVQTVGELELIALVAEGAALIDTRVGDSRSGATLPGARHLPHDQVAERTAELDRERISVLFCNGPQCPQTPDAIATLLAAGYPAAQLAYYRGGMHDWLTLGYPPEVL